MQDKDFLDGMDRLRSTFGAQFYPKEKENLIAAKVRYLPRGGWLEIIDNLIMAKRYAPTPVEIIEETKNWQRAHPSSFDVETPPRELECADCFETGWLFFEHEEHGGSIMCCHCKDGLVVFREEIGIPIPRFEKNKFERLFGFKPKDFPIEKFKPADGDVNRIFKKGHDVVDWWKEERAKAREFWIAVNEGRRAAQP